MLAENSLFGLGVLLCFLWVWSLTFINFKGLDMRKCPEISLISECSKAALLSKAAVDD